MDLSDVVGDVQSFFDLQASRCSDLGIDVTPLPVSHVAYRTRTWREYVSLRRQLEELCSANLENVWNGRPISKLLLHEPIRLSPSQSLDMVELIPPFHQRVYKMGLEHYAFVVGVDAFPAFVQRHRGVLTGQQFQSRFNEPVYILFPDYTHVKFHQMSLGDACRREGRTFDGFHHVEWQPADELAGPYEVS